MYLAYLDSCDSDSQQKLIWESFAGEPWLVRMDMDWEREVLKLLTTEALSTETVTTHLGAAQVRLVHLRRVGDNGHTLSNDAANRSAFQRPEPTGDPVLDHARYSEAKAQWMMEHPNWSREHPAQERPPTEEE